MYESNIHKVTVLSFILANFVWQLINLHSNKHVWRRIHLSIWYHNVQMVKCIKWHAFWLVKTFSFSIVCVSKNWLPVILFNIILRSLKQLWRRIHLNIWHHNVEMDKCLRCHNHISLCDMHFLLVSPFPFLLIWNNWLSGSQRFYIIINDTERN